MRFLLGFTLGLVVAKHHTPEEVVLVVMLALVGLFGRYRQRA